MSIFVLLMTVARLLTALLVCDVWCASCREQLTTSSPSSTAYSVIRIVRQQWKEPANPPRTPPPHSSLKGRRLIKGPGDILLTFVKFLPNKISTSRAHKAAAAAARELKRCVLPVPKLPFLPACLPARWRTNFAICQSKEPWVVWGAAAGKSQTLTKRRKTCDTKCGEA